MNQLITRPVVLVVEDESLIRIGTAETLEDAGCSALQAADGAEALAHLLRTADIWALFSDIGLPGSVSGLALAHEVHKSRPGIRLILTSGRARPESRDMPPGAWFVAKPYAARDLAIRMMRSRGPAA